MRVQIIRDGERVIMSRRANGTLAAMQRGNFNLYTGKVMPKKKKNLTVDAVQVQENNNRLYPYYTGYGGGLQDGKKYDVGSADK